MNTINGSYEGSCKNSGDWIPFLLYSHSDINLNAFSEGRLSVSLLLVLIWRFGEREEVEVTERNGVTSSGVNKKNHRIVGWPGKPK